MSKRTKPIYAVATPFESAPIVTLYEDTWDDHVLPGHPEMTGQEKNTAIILQEPTAVVKGTTNSSHVGFLSQKIVSPSGSPLVVFVNTQEQIVVTASYRRDFKNVDKTQLLWSPSNTKPPKRP